MLYAVFIALCAAGTPVKACTPETALDWIAAPEAQQGLAACMIHGQEYAAASRLVAGGVLVKVYCRPVAAQPEGSIG